MERVISVEAFKNILTAASPAVANVDEDTKKALAAMWGFCSEKKETLILVDLTEYEDYILWRGADDVRALAESGCYQEEIGNMSEAEQEALFAKVAENVDWSDVASAGVEAGNRLIENELEAVLTKE